MSTGDLLFAGRVALITGASRGIGFSIAEDLVRHGARVCITARDPGRLQEAIGRLGAGGNAMASAGASDDAEHRLTTTEAVVERFGALDIVVNNAAVNPHYGHMVTGDAGVATKVMAVNVVAAFAWVKEAWDRWLAEHGGVVLNIASLGGLVPGQSIGFYNTSKAALIHMTRQLALELAPGVRVNALAPAVVKTHFARALYEGREDSVAREYPLGRLGSPRDVASAARFLLSDEASWITGQTLVLDGGRSLAGWGGEAS